MFKPQLGHWRLQNHQKKDPRVEAAAQNTRAPLWTHLTKDCRSTKSPVQQAARAMSSTVFGFLSLLQLPRNSSVPPCTSIESERLFAWSLTTRMRKYVITTEKAEMFFLMRKNLQLKEQNSSFLLLIWKFQFLLSLKIYNKKNYYPLYFYVTKALV